MFLYPISDGWGEKKLNEIVIAMLEKIMDAASSILTAAIMIKQ